MTTPVLPPGPMVSDPLRQAWLHYGRSDLTVAEQLCHAALETEPTSYEAVVLLGLLCARTQRMTAAEAQFARAIELRPEEPSAHLNRGAALRSLGRFEAALESYERALALQPNSPEAHFNRGNLLQQLGRPVQAIASYDRALSYRAAYTLAHFNRGNALLALERAEEAAESYRSALASDPGFAEAHLNLGNALRAQQHLETALQSYERALSLQPRSAEAALNSAIVLLELKRPEPALQHCVRALEQWPASAEAHQTCGLALQALQRPHEALHHHQRVLELEPNHFRAWCSLGVARQRLSQLSEAKVCFERAVTLAPEHPEPYLRLGDILLESNEFEAAIQRYDQVLERRNDHAEAYCHRGMALFDLRRLEAAELSFSAALRLDPQLPWLLGMALHVQLQLGQWENFEAARTSLLATLARAPQSLPPLTTLALTDSAALQRLAAEHWYRELERRSGTSLAYSSARSAPHARLRVGYLSGDFREHPVAYLLTGVLEQHDRGSFELYAFSLRASDDSPYGTRIRSAVDRFVDLSALSDEEAAERIRNLEIDILVDLVGYTQGERPRILARRPAPIQVNYLGFPATLGAPYIDYLIADEYLIPEATQPHYSEQIVYLPECFQANDDRRFLPESRPDRASLELPEHSLVLCSFNSTYKINPSLFSIWMRLLQAVPASVLWLPADSHIVERNLRAEAAARGVNPSRLLFAPRLPYGQHLTRLAAADLFLDTLPFNGGTTVSDALWVGVPVLSCSGEALASRMGGSLLRAVNLSELIAADLAHYEQLALELLSSPERLASLRARLIGQRKDSPLFNTARFTRHLEQAFRSMQDAIGKGVPTSPIHVPRHS